MSVRAPQSSSLNQLHRVTYKRKCHLTDLSNCRIETIVRFSYILFLSLWLSVSAFANVTVSFPTSGSTVGSPVTYSATASSSTCSKGVASMGVYVDGELDKVVQGASLNVALTMTAGAHSTVVQEWDYCGGSTYTPVAITVTNQAGVWVTSPANQGQVNSPVNYAATATTNCSKGVASMGIYVNDQLTQVVNGANLATNLSLGPGSYNTVVQEWDYCGGSTFSQVPITVTSPTSVIVTSPANNTQVSSPVNYAAMASTGSCAKGVASMGIYVDGNLEYVTNSATLNQQLGLSAGSHQTVVEEWDNCGGASYTPVNLTVESGGDQGSFASLQASTWDAAGQGPPDYDDCNPCGPQITWSEQQGISSPSLSGDATEFSIGGDAPYWDVLFDNHLIGTYSTQGLPDQNHTLTPALHNFTYDVYFYGANLGVAEALEFDFNQFFDGLSFIWGHNCYIAGGGIWQLWSNEKNDWFNTDIPCNPVSNQWNHLTIAVERTSSNQLLYKTITLNGVTYNVNIYDNPGSAPQSWWGITINYQMDGNYQQAPYSVYVDNLTFTYQ
jgi:hypothetical protein